MALLILDVNMPVMTGLQVAAKVKELFMAKQVSIEQNQSVQSFSSKQLQRPLVIFQSSLNYDVMEKLCFENEKADLFVQKPFSVKTLG